LLAEVDEAVAGLAGVTLMKLFEPPLVPVIPIEPIARSLCRKMFRMKILLY
jgi:hypothetical protein